MTKEEKKLLIAVAMMCLEPDAPIAAALRTRIGRLIGVVETPMDRAEEQRDAD